MTFIRNDRTQRVRRWTGSVVAVVAALTLTATLVGPGSQASAATSKQVIVNGNFAKGVVGWKTDDATRHPLVGTSDGRSGSAAAKIVPSDASTVVLQPVKDTVRSANTADDYAVAAWVRSTRAGGTAQLKVEQVGASATTASTSQHVFKDTKWHKLALDVKANEAGAALRLSFIFSGTAAGQALYVDDVSFLSSTGHFPAEPPVPPVTDPSTPPTKPGTPGESVCSRPAPPSGTQFGSSISTSSAIHGPQAIADRDAIFGKIPVVRIWDEPMPFSWSDPRTEALKGRTLVMSFRPAPADVLSGKYDSALRTWFEKAPSTSRIYWNYYHEPETPIDDQKIFTADEYRAAWRHIDKIADSVCRQNMYSTLVLMGWTANPQSHKDWRTYYPGDDVIDVLAFDPYNGVHDPQRDYYASPASMYDDVVAVAREAGKPYGIAETGSRKIPSDPTGVKRAAWLSEVAKYNRENGALFVTYFQSPRDGEWRLLDKPSQDAWRAAVSSSSH